MYSLCFFSALASKAPLVQSSPQWILSSPYQLETILLFSYTSPFPKVTWQPKGIKCHLLAPIKCQALCGLSHWILTMLQGGPILQMRKWELWEVKQFAQVYTGSQLRDQDSNPDLLVLKPMFFPVYHVNSSIPVKHTVALLSTCCSLTSYLT